MNRTIEELATILAGYAVLYPAVDDLTFDAADGEYELEALTVRNKIGKIIRGNLRKGEPPEDYGHIPGWEQIKEQYLKDGVTPTKSFAIAHSIANAAIEAADEGVINNLVCGLSIFSAYIDARGSFRHFPIVSAKTAANMTDLAWKYVEKEKVKHSMDVAEKIVDGIVERCK